MPEPPHAETGNPEYAPQHDAPTEVGKDPVRQYPARAEEQTVDRQETERLLQERMASDGTKPEDATADAPPYANKPGDAPIQEYIEELAREPNDEFSDQEIAETVGIVAGVIFVVVLLFFVRKAIRAFKEGYNNAERNPNTMQRQTEGATKPQAITSLAEVLKELERRNNASATATAQHKVTQTAQNNAVNDNTRTAILADQKYSLSKDESASKRDMERWMRSVESGPSVESAPGVEQMARSVEQTARRAEMSPTDAAKYVDYDTDSWGQNRHSYLTETDHTFKRSEGRSAQLKRKGSKVRKWLAQPDSLKRAYIASMVLDRRDE